MSWTNTTGVLENQIREELPAVLNECLPAIAPIYNMIEQTSIGVERDTMGRGWEVIHLFSTGVAGLMESSDPLGPTMLNITGNQLTVLDGITAAGAASMVPFPTANESPHTSSIKRTLALSMSTGNFSMPITWMQADQLTATQIKQVSRDIKAVGELRAIIEATSFFHYVADDSSSNKTHVLGRVSSFGESGSTNYVDIVINEAYGRISNFRIGMSIDVVATSTDTLQAGTATDGTDVLNYDGSNNYIRLYITSVDYQTKTIRVVGINNSTGATAAFADGTGWDGSHPITESAWIVLARCSRYTTATRPMMSWGLEDWMASSGYIMSGSSGAGGLDLGSYPQFKSQVVAVNGPLTDKVMNGYIGGFLDYFPGASLDTIITTQGVTLKYLEQPELYNSRLNYDRTGKALNVAGGWSNVSYEFNGRSLKWIISPMCLSNRLYGLKLANGNIKRYVPPRIGGSDDRVGSEIEFLAPLGGHNGIFMPSTSSTGAPMNVVQAPFWQYKLVAPLDVKGVKLTGLTEATLT